MAYRICQNCIMDTSAEEISFDDQGICSFCHGFQAMASKLPINKDAEFNRIVEKIKSDGINKQYDSILGVSGGVDSTYLAWVAKSQGLRPLIVHVDAGWNSEIAVGNIERLVKILEFDLFTFVVDWEEMKDLQRAFLLARLPNCDIPQDHAFFAALYKIAHEKGIHHILSGHNIFTEFVLPRSWGFPSEDYYHILDVHRKFGRAKLTRFPLMTLFDQAIYYRLYFPLHKHRFLYYLNYNSNNIKNFITDTLGWRDYGGKHFESRFTKFFQSYYLPQKFGFDKRRAHLSNLVVSGQISRHEALLEIEKPSFDPAAISEDIDFLCRKLDISKEEWSDIMTKPNRSHNEFDSDSKSRWQKIWRWLKN